MGRGIKITLGSRLSKRRNPPPSPPAEAPAKEPGFLERMAVTLGHLRTAILEASVLVALVAVVVTIVVDKARTPRKIVVQPISVSKAFSEEYGYADEVLAGKIIEYTRLIRAEAEGLSYGGSTNLKYVSGQEFEPLAKGRYQIEGPSGTISLQPLVDRLPPFPRTVTGNLTRDAQMITLTLRGIPDGIDSRRTMGFTASLPASSPSAPSKPQAPERKKQDLKSDQPQLSQFSSPASPIERLLFWAAKKIVSTSEPYLFAQYQYAHKKDAAAVRTLQSCLRDARPEKRAYLYNLWGLTYTRAREFDDAQAKFRQAMAADQYFAAPYANLGVVYLRRGRKEDRAALSCELRGSKGAALAHNAAARTYNQRAAEWFLAAIACAKLRRLRDIEADAQADRGIALRRLRRYAEAEASYQAATRIKPNDSRTWSNWAEVYLSWGKLARAEHVYRSTLSWDPQSPDAWNGVGMVAFRQGKLDAAKTAFEKAARLDPEWEEPRWRLGLIWERKRKPSEASKWYRAAATLEPDLPPNRSLATPLALSALSSVKQNHRP